ncbi:substance-P receptor-like isoform X1 [Oculina patagonica]
MQGRSQLRPSGQKKMASTETITFTVLYAITFLVSTVGNILLIYIVWKKPDARSLTSFMFVNMAVADLLVTFVVIPYTISDFYTGNVWPMRGLIGEITCRAVLYVAFFTISTSILCLTFMAIDRFYAVVYPLRRLLWFRRPKVLTPIVWILPMALLSIVLVFVGLFPRDSKYVCGADYTTLGEKTKAIRGVYTYFFVINYLVPVSIISILYTITARKLWFHEAPGDDVSQNRQQQQLTKRKVVRMLIIVFTAFALCWLPGQVYQLYMAITSNTLQTVASACFWFGYNNSAINPWLYIGLNSKMHSAFSRMTGKKKHDLKRESKEMTPTAINETQNTDTRV